MESAYIKETVGPVLAKALTSIILHCPQSQHSSSYSCKPDPITILAKYLIEYDRLEKEGVEISERQEALNKLLSEFAQKEAQERESRVRFNTELAGRVSVLKPIVEAQLESETKFVAPANIPEAAAEESQPSAAPVTEEQAPPAEEQ